MTLHNKAAPGMAAVLWHGAAGLAAGAIPAQWRAARSIWEMPREEIVFVAGLVACYWLIAAVLGRVGRAGHDTGPARSIGAGLAVLVVVFALYAFGLVLTEGFYSRSIYLGAIAMSTLFVVLSPWLATSARLLLGPGLLVGVALLQSAGSQPAIAVNRALGQEPKPQMSRTTLASHLQLLDVATFSNHFRVCPDDGGECRSPHMGGGLQMLGDAYLLAHGDGTLRVVSPQIAERRLQQRVLVHRIPINPADYLADLGPIVKDTFRVTDVLVIEDGPRLQLYAAHHFWKRDQKCGVLRVSRTEGDRDSFIAATRAASWQTVYETSPCLPASGGHLTRGSESGGRLAFIAPGQLLLTVGDHEFDGVNRTPVAAQDASSSYGKTVLIDTASGRAELFTRGHRNPQGLFVDAEGTVWATEHGPRGGDELNILRRGANYGWPTVTLGTQYALFDWPLSQNQGRHDGFEAPVFAWTPSVAVGDLVRVGDGVFPRWRGDLLVASYTRTLHRLRLDAGRVVAVEPIPVAGRIRHLLQNPRGELVLYLDSGTLVVIGAATAEGTDRGTALFAGCTGCHRVGDGKAHGIGPDLAGLFGRRIAGSPGFAYSPALAARQGAWDDATLDAFLADPQKFAPGTSMAFPGIADAADRAALLRHLRQVLK